MKKLLYLSAMIFALASCSTEEEIEPAPAKPEFFTGTFVVAPVMPGTTNEGGALIGSMEYSLGDGPVQKFTTTGQMTRFEKTYTNLKKGDIINFKINFYGAVNVYCLDGNGKLILSKVGPMVAGSGGGIPIVLY